jgi:hypothetical protein
VYTHTRATLRYINHNFVYSVIADSRTHGK